MALDVFVFCPETESLRSLLGGREAEAVTLREHARKEREDLMARLLRDKGRCAVLLLFPSSSIGIKKRVYHT